LFISSRTVFGNGADSANPNNVQNIWVMNADGTFPTPLTAYSGPAGFITAAAFTAAWSPVPIGGQFQIVFVSYGKLDGSDNPGPNNAFNIWLMNADGSLRTPLTSLTVASISSSPAWQP
jgi:Tol biopolymer transport system component